jgi:hypothetical protein
MTHLLTLSPKSTEEVAVERDREEAAQKLRAELIMDKFELADELYIEDELDRKEERARMIAEVREAEGE